MKASLKNSEHYLQRKTVRLSDIENATKNSPVEGTPRVMTSIEDSGSVSRLDSPGGGSCPEEALVNRISSLERETMELENGNISPMQEMSSSFDEVSTDGSISQDVDQLTPSEGVDDSTSDDDRGGDFTVSKYMQSKISRLDEARFGVWRVENIETQTGLDNPMDLDSCAGGQIGTWEVAGPSNSAEGLPPLKLTLKKSLQGNEPDEQLPPKEKITKKKHKTKLSPSEPKDPQKRRRPGRPPTNNPPSLSTRQRLMNMFKKKYFKDRKRWARTKSTGSMPPTIRSIAKP